MKKNLHSTIMYDDDLSLVGCSKSQKSNDANSNTNILDTSYDEILKSAKELQ